MKVRFWGVRGSVPWATPSSIEHGCNTPCVEVTSDDGADTVVLDAGTGIVGVSNTLLAATPRAISIVLTHYHWDHIQGFPFFAPIFTSGWRPTVYAPALDSVDREWFGTLFRAPFFPVAEIDLPGRPVMKEVGRGANVVAGFTIRAERVNHPGGALAFRIAGLHGDLVYAPDHEFGDAAVDAALLEFVTGASALILNAHFTPDESPLHVGWGHSNWRDAAKFAAASRVQRLWLFHHKPGRTDLELKAIREAARPLFAAVEIAAEGVTFDV